MHQERRRHPRAACHIRVEYAQPGAKLVARAVATDISCSGLRARASLRPDLSDGDLVPMTLFLEDGPVKVQARIVYSATEGFAVAFHGIEGDAADRLGDFVSRANAFRR
ncbi:MAG: PilZ domain-containing protein [Candidatus Sericytochromatia bacterium]|nr:PilZ domain-containing protein [Candidatus Tanganyikabacteria bacterium]